MDSTQNNNPGARLDATGAQIADPFAVDLFALPSTNVADDGAEAGESSDSAGDDSYRAARGVNSPSLPAWHLSLPRITTEQARLSRSTRALPVALTADAQGALTRTLARFVNRPAGFADTVAIESIAARETELAIEPNTSQIVFINLAVEPEAERLAFALPRDFAVRLIDCVLGGGGGEADDESHSRELSVVERAVIEFLCLNLVRQLNREAGGDVLRFDSVADAPPAWLPDGEAAETLRDSRGVLVVSRVVITPNVECLVRGFIPSRSMRALDASTNTLLRRSFRARSRARLRTFADFTSGVRLRLRVGETSLSAADVAEIDEGDVVIVAQSQMDGGRATVFAGDADNFRLAGRLQRANGSPDLYAFRLEKLDSSQPTPQRGRWQMNEASEDRADADAAWRASDEDAKDAESADAAARLENLMLTVHVELAARCISLDELAALEPDQIIELGCRPTDPVELVVENRSIARGELVEIEGRLGVRVTHVMR